MAVVNQELYCHNCGQYVQFQLDEEMDGEHIIICPNCKHDHYRYINKGIISDQRWGQSPSQQIASVSVPVATYYATVTGSATSSISVNVQGWITSGTGYWTAGTYGTSGV